MALEVVRIINQPVSSNCFLLYDLAINNDCLVVDPGSKNADELEKRLVELKLFPRYILLTHEHFDHIWGVDRIRSKYNCKLISSFVCSELVTESKKNLSLFYDQKGFCCLPADMVIEDLMNPFVWNKYEIYFYNTPGHTEGSICISIDAYLFTGDTLMWEVETPTKLPGGSAAKLKDSLAFIKSYFANTMIVFPGHGEKFRLSECISCRDK